MAELGEDGTSSNEVEWGVPDQIECTRCGSPLDDHKGKDCAWQN